MSLTHCKDVKGINLYRMTTDTAAAHRNGHWSIKEVAEGNSSLGNYMYNIYQQNNHIQMASNTQQFEGIYPLDLGNFGPYQILASFLKCRKLLGGFLKMA